MLLLPWFGEMKIYRPLYKSWWHCIWPLTLRAFFELFQFRLYLLTSFSVRRYIFRILRSWFCFKVMVQGQGHGNKKAIARNSKTTVRKFPGLDRNICYDNARINLELWHFDLDLWPRDVLSYFSIQAPRFECFNPAVLISVRRGTSLEYLGSPSSLKVMGLTSRSRLQNSGSTQVCAPTDIV